jgi:IS30 family transposase
LGKWQGSANLTLDNEREVTGNEAVTKIIGEALDRIAFLINNHPRKRLGYKTPLEVFRYWIAKTFL